MTGVGLNGIMERDLVARGRSRGVGKDDVLGCTGSAVLGGCYVATFG